MSEESPSLPEYQVAGSQQQLTMNIKELIARSLINKSMNSKIMSEGSQQKASVILQPDKFQSSIIGSNQQNSNTASLINNINNRRQSIIQSMPMFKSTNQNREGEIDFGTDDENEQLLMKIKLARERIKIRDNQLSQVNPQKPQEAPIISTDQLIPGQSSQLKQLDIKKNSNNIAQETIIQFRQQPTKKIKDKYSRSQSIQKPRSNQSPPQQESVSNALGSYFKNIFNKQVAAGLNQPSAIFMGNLNVNSDPNNDGVQRPLFSARFGANQASDYYKKKTEEQIEQIEQMDAQFVPQSLFLPVIINKSLDASSMINTAPIGIHLQGDRPMVVEDFSQKISKFEDFRTPPLIQHQANNLMFIPSPHLNNPNSLHGFDLNSANKGQSQDQDIHPVQVEESNVMDPDQIAPEVIDQPYSNKDSISDSGMEMSSQQNDLDESMNRSSNQKSVTQGQGDDEYNHEEDNKLNLNFMIDEQMMIENLPFAIIHPQALWKTIWNVALLLIIIALAVTVPYRIAFEDVTPIEWIYIDTFVDFTFIIDMILNFFTAMESDQGEVIGDRKQIISSYLKSWFFVDLTSCIPISLIQYLTTNEAAQVDSNGNSLVNLRIIKLTRLPRLYRLLRLVKLMRLYKSNKFIQTISMRINLSITTTRLIKSFIMVFFLIHLIGCVWVTIAVLNPFDDPVSWITASGLIDSSDMEIYIASIYWAAVSIYTVGYGDITSQNNFELTCNIIILFFGITLYTYIFSQLSALFSSVSQKEENKTSERMIMDLAQAYAFPDYLTKRIQFFFSQTSNLISLSKEYGIDQLLEILPPHLKAEITTFLYQNAIDTVQILRDREMRFYGDYLYRFEPMSIKNGSIFAKEGMNANEVYFLLSGCVECENQKKYYLPGTVFGETDVVLGRKRTDSYKTIDDSYILKLNKATFNEIMDEFTDFRDDIHKMVMDRERNRLERIQQQRLRKEMQDQFNELNKLVKQIDFNQLQNMQGTNQGQGSGDSSFMTSHTPITPMHGYKSIIAASPLKQKSNEDKEEEKDPFSLSIHLQPGDEDIKTDEKILTGDSNSQDKKHGENPSNLYQPIKYRAMKSIRSVYSRHVAADDSQSALSNQYRKHREGGTTDGETEHGAVSQEKSKDMKSNRLGPVQIMKQLLMLKESITDTIERQSNMSKSQRNDGHYSKLGTKRFSTSNQKPKLKREDSIQSAAHQNNNKSPLDNMIIVDQLDLKAQQNQDKKPQNKANLDNSDALKRSSTEHFNLRKKKEQKADIPVEIQQFNILEEESQFNEEDFFLQNKLKPLQMPLTTEAFTNELRQSLERLTAREQSEEHVQRDKTQRQHPVEGGYKLEYEQIPEEESIKTSQSLSENTPQNNDNNDSEDISEIKKLRSNINLCMESVDFTKKLIDEYIKIFEMTIYQIGDDGNELFRRQFQQGLKGLKSYLEIMNMIQGMTQTMNIQMLGAKLTQSQVKSLQLEKRYYFLENRVKMISEVVVIRLKALEKEKEIMLKSKQLIVKKNPLLDQRDDEHSLLNKRLMGRPPTNM